MLLRDVIKLKSGSPQFRIKISGNPDSRVYNPYGQAELENDLVDCDLREEAPKIIRTDDKVNTLAQGDVVFSLVNGKATIVSAKHDGYLQTQNYVKLDPIEGINKKYLVYLINDNPVVKSQLSRNIQGSAVLKYTIQQLSQVDLPDLPDAEKQILIGDIYFDCQKLYALRIRLAENTKTLDLLTIEDFNSSDAFLKSHNIERN